MLPETLEKRFGTPIFTSSALPAPQRSTEKAMATLTRFDEAFDDLLRGFFVRPVGLEGGHNQAAPAHFRVEVSESEQSYVIRAEIPGVKKEDINISIDADQVAISAE